ncbi:unnamed protein product [Anisakis simplex]|uniref:Uncharacterized protein n=1 Tax=Anisakis simplex TaxID=6269 RepID=A0A0M3JSR9_ANISI|nr:unnamed protein product [Anisakis simplex]
MTTRSKSMKQKFRDGTSTPTRCNPEQATNVDEERGDDESNVQLSLYAILSNARLPSATAASSANASSYSPQFYTLVPGTYASGRCFVQTASDQHTATAPPPTRRSVSKVRSNID